MNPRIRSSLFPALILVLVFVLPVLAADSEMFKKAENFYNSGKLEMALLFYNKEISLNPDNAAAYYHRGRILLNNRDYSSAKEDLRKARELDPRNTDAFYFLGLAAMGMTNASEAIASFAKVPENSRYYPDSFENAGNTWYVLKHDATNTIRCWETYLELKPDNDQADNIRRAIECLKDPDCFAQALAALAARSGQPGAGGPSAGEGSSTNMSSQTADSNKLKIEEIFMPDIQGEASKAGVSKQKGSEDKKSIQTE